MNQLLGLRRADAAIVGGGLTGLLLGAALTREGMRIAILDAGEGATLACAGAATVQCAPVYARIQAAHGLDAARLYAGGLQSQLHALTAAPLPYVRLTEVYTYAATQEELPLLERQSQLLSEMHLPFSVAPDAGGCPFPVELSLRAPGQALVDVPRWTAALQRDILRRGGRIYSGSRVEGIEGLRVCTALGCIQAPLVILTTGTPLGLRRRRLLALLECRTLARCRLTGDAPLHSCQQSVREEGLSLYPTALGAIATWEAGRAGTRRTQARLTRFGQVLSSRLPDFLPGGQLFSQDIYPADGLPVIGALPDSRLLCAGGYSGYGVLGAMHAAALLTRRILGRALPEDAVYAPDRRVPEAILRRQMRRSDGLYLRSLLRRNTPACAHCGCHLRFSAPADRWECPCCGSAYSVLGQALRAPGMADARLSPRQRPL